MSLCIPGMPMLEKELNKLYNAHKWMHDRRNKLSYINIIFQFMKPVTTVIKSHMIYHKNHPHFFTFIFTF